MMALERKNPLSINFKYRGIRKATMEEKKYSNAKRAITIISLLTAFVAGFELFMAFSHYQPGMTICDVASHVSRDNLIVYFLLLIIANIVFLPAALLLYKENGISLKDEIYDKKTLWKDILYGVIAFVVAEIAGLITDIKNYIPGIKATELACARSETGISVTVLGFIALVLVSGILKEIYFRGLAKRFCGPVFGEITALLLSNVLFAVFDWHNLGHSFIIGLVWIYAYKKTGHLITPMICHVGAGLYYVTYTVIALI